MASRASSAAAQRRRPHLPAASRLIGDLRDEVSLLRARLRDANAAVRAARTGEAEALDDAAEHAADADAQRAATARAARSADAEVGGGNHTMTLACRVRNNLGKNQGEITVNEQRSHITPHTGRRGAAAARRPRQGALDARRRAR